jgi:hypothetical protein
MCGFQDVQPTPHPQQPFSTRNFELGGLSSATKMTPVKILLVGVSGDGRNIINLLPVCQVGLYQYFFI